MNSDPMNSVSCIAINSRCWFVMQIQKKNCEVFSCVDAAHCVDDIVLSNRARESNSWRDLVWQLCFAIDLFTLNVY